MLRRLEFAHSLCLFCFLPGIRLLLPRMQVVHKSTQFLLIVHAVMAQLQSCCSAEKAAREQGLSQSNSRAVTADYNSLSSDRSSVNSAAAGMRIASPYDASVWVQPSDTILEDIAGNELDAQDASYAFEQLKTIKQKPGKPAFQAYVKAGYEANEHSGKDRYSYGAKDGYNKEGYSKDGYGQGQDQRYHTQADSYGEEDSGRSLVMKDRDPVSVLPSHLYSTDDENSTQHAISGSNSAQTQPNTSMHMSGKAASLHLPSISDIYAVIGENQKAGAMPQDPLNGVSVCDNGGSIHYQEYEPSNLASAVPPQGRTAGGIKPGLKPVNSTSPTGLFGQQNGGLSQQDAYFTADSAFVNPVNDGLVYGRPGMVFPHLLWVASVVICVKCGAAVPVNLCTCIQCLSWLHGCHLHNARHALM